MRRKKASYLGVLLAVQLTWTPAVLAVGGYDDAQVEKRVRSELEHLHIKDLALEVLGWQVTLSGTAESLAQARQAEKLAMQEPAIKEVFNDIQVVYVEDEPLRRAVVAAMEKDRRHYTAYDLIHVSVEDGRVRLSGHALDPKEVEAIETTVSKVRGVAAIKNDIEMSPMSSTDEKLQTTLVVTINDALTQYINANPSIHVMVRDGHVSLSGYVDGAEARRAVEKAVRSTDGVLSVNNGLEARR